MNLIPWRNKNASRTGEVLPVSRSLSQFHDEWNRLMNRFFNEPFGLMGWSPMTEGWGLVARADLTETDDAFEVQLEIPGVDPKDVDVEVTDNVLHVRGQKTREESRKDRNTWYEEREFGSFSRSIPLPAAVHADKVEAVFKNGVLTVTMPKSEKAKGRKVVVRNA